MSLSPDVLDEEHRKPSSTSTPTCDSSSSRC
jgi:hypothetical protein